MREAFAALDAGAAPGATTWTHAGARQAEAGFEDPALGWIGVRADLSGGGVHAAVVPGSAEAAQELGRHMDGLHAHLAEHGMPLASLALATSENRSGAGAGAGSDSSKQGENPDAHPEGGRNSQQESYRQPESNPAPRGAEIKAAFSAGTSITAIQSPDAPDLQAGKGVHISVVA